MRNAPLLGIQPALLKWARESANMSIDDVAEKLNKPIDAIIEWETGSKIPSYPQLEKLAYDLYKRPLAIFFLPAPPDEPKATAEFRSLPDADLGNLARDTVILIRKARAFQFALRELFQGHTPADAPIWRTIKLSASSSIVAQAAQVRVELGISLDEQLNWKDDDEALKRWRRAIETRGVFVFKDTFKQREISGFCLNDPEFPTIMINNTTTKTRQIFSLLHELAHILIDRSGISTFEQLKIEGLSLGDRKVERFCNSIAAEILVPVENFRRLTDTLNFSSPEVLDQQITAFAKQLKVSRAVVLRRVLVDQSISQEFYDQKTREWDAQQSKGGSGGNYYATQKAYLSERFAREVFVRYERRQLSRDEAAELIGVSPKNFSGLEELVLRGAA